MSTETCWLRAARPVPDQAARGLAQPPVFATADVPGRLYGYLTVFICIAAVALRLLLCWANPPSNSFDNHYEPIIRILATGSIPDKNACFQCYHPPVFYYTSALAARTLLAMGMQSRSVIKSLQFLNCFYGILTIGMIYLILKKFHLSRFSRLAALSFVCFLPRHIYMSAMHSNDCLSYLAVSVCLYCLLVTLDKKLSLSMAALTGAAAAVAVFVKYTAFIAIPMLASPLLILLVKHSEVPRSKCAAALFCALAPPLFLLGTYCAFNYATYGKGLPWNDATLNTAAVHPRDSDQVSFFSFMPWLYMQNPIVMPGQMHSFWTLLYSGLWVDNEPKFTYYTDLNRQWWAQYYMWLRGERGFPEGAIPISALTRVPAQVLLAAGLVPLCLLVLGLVQSLRRLLLLKNAGLDMADVKLQALPIMIICNAAGIMLITLSAPVYSSMKATYLLTAMPAFAVLVAAGLTSIETKKWLKQAAAAAFVILMLFSSLAVFRIVWSMRVIGG